MNLRFEKEYLEATIKYLEKRIDILKDRPIITENQNDLIYDISNSLCITVDRLQQELETRKKELDCINEHLESIYDISKNLGDDYYKIIDLKSKGFTLDRIAMDMNMSRSTVIRRIKEVEELVKTN